MMGALAAKFEVAGRKSASVEMDDVESTAI